MENKIKDKSASNIMDSTGYWREYPERDLEHVRRYPVTVEIVNENDVWKKSNMKLVCVLPEDLASDTDKNHYISAVQKELHKQAEENYIKNLTLEEVIVWDKGSAFDEAEYNVLFNLVKELFDCKSDLSLSVKKTGEYKELKIWDGEMPILAAGAGARGYIKGCDYFNIESVSEYIESAEKGEYPLKIAFTVTAKEVLARTFKQAINIGKLSLEEFQRRHGFYFEKVFEDEIKELEKKKYLKLHETECVFIEQDKIIEILHILMQVSGGMKYETSKA